MDLQQTGESPKTSVIERSVVFINYSHDTVQHKEKVFGIYKALRTHGLDCKIDQAVQNPPEGWPQWMVNRLEEADYVLVVCTEIYNARFNKKVPVGEGKGGTWEGAVINQSLYENSTQNTKFIPVILHKDDLKHIPMILKSATNYLLPDKMKDLYGRLTGQDLFEEVLLGEITLINPEQTPSASWLTEKLVAPTAIQFGWDDLKEVILSLHDVVKAPDGSSDSKEDFFVVELEQKNKINGMGQAYSQMMTNHHEVYFGRINAFLESPVNVEIKEKYFEVVDELRAKIAVLRPKVESFELILQAFVDEAVTQDSGTLKIKRSVLNILISFMYVNCDIGQKS